MGRVSVPAFVSLYLCGYACLSPLPHRLRPSASVLVPMARAHTRHTPCTSRAISASSVGLGAGGSCKDAKVQGGQRYRKTQPHTCIHARTHAHRHTDTHIDTHTHTQSQTGTQTDTNIRVHMSSIGPATAQVPPDCSAAFVADALAADAARTLACRAHVIQDALQGQP